MSSKTYIFTLRKDSKTQRIWVELEPAAPVVLLKKTLIYESLYGFDAGNVLDTFI
jgi:hypothetical protein